MMKMHNTDTIDYAAQIKQNAAYLRDRHAMHPMADTLDRHADAFAAKLAEAEARVGRLKELIDSRRHYDDILDQDGVEPSRRYPALRVVIDRFHAAVAACHEHGDLTDTDGDGP
jgi:hypothetical protein